jgi:hypothetical protein
MSYKSIGSWQWLVLLIGARVLGEGDYTYSLDACRYLSSTSSSSALTDDANTTANIGDTENNSNVVHHHKITCTGIDLLNFRSSIII